MAASDFGYVWVFSLFQWHFRVIINILLNNLSFGRPPLYCELKVTWSTGIHLNGVINRCRACPKYYWHAHGVELNEEIITKKAEKKKKTGDNVTTTLRENGV